MAGLLPDSNKSKNAADKFQVQNYNYATFRGYKTFNTNIPTVAIPVTCRVTWVIPWIEPILLMRILQVAFQMLNFSIFNSKCGCAIIISQTGVSWKDHIKAVSPVLSSLLPAVGSEQPKSKSSNIAHLS